jgi:hypothetical protein
MATEPKSRRRQRKKVLRKNDGSLYDATERRRITAGELRDYVRDGGLFEARWQDTGADCTYEVLQDVLGVSLLQSLVPGMGGGGIPGLGALAGGGGALGALGGAAGLAEIVRALGESPGRRDPGWDDWDEAPRRSSRRGGSDHRAWADRDWSDARRDAGGSSDPPRGPARRDGDDWAGDPGSD